MNKIDLIFDKERLLNTLPVVKYTDKILPNQYGKTKALYLKGEPYNGRETWNFAYVGIPNCEKPKDGFPAIVVAHGGGGCAFHEWVEFWNKKGYVAIAPDLSGQRDGDTSFDGKGAPENPDGGPKGYRPFGTTLENYKDSWFYHTVCNAINAHNYLRSLSQVNVNKTVMTGISWGSVATMWTGGIDDRFACFAPVYGGGFLHKDPMFLKESNPPENEELWLNNFDPLSYVKRISKPIMFTSGADDPAFSVLNNMNTWNTALDKKYYSWRQTLFHYHRWADEEQMINVYRFFEKVLFGKEMPFEILSENIDKDTLSVTLDGVKPNVTAKIVFNKSELDYDNAKLKWESEPAFLSGNTFTAKVPENANLCFMEISDGQELEFVLSSEMYRISK